MLPGSALLVHTGRQCLLSAGMEPDGGTAAPTADGEDATVPLRLVTPEWTPLVGRAVRACLTGSTAGSTTSASSTGATCVITGVLLCVDPETGHTFVAVGGDQPAPSEPDTMAAGRVAPSGEEGKLSVKVLMHHAIASVEALDDQSFAAALDVRLMAARPRDAFRLDGDASRRQRERQQAVLDVLKAVRVDTVPACRMRVCVC